MTLSDRAFVKGTVAAIGGDPETHRRLTDLGLNGARCSVKARRSWAVLASFDDFSAVVGAAAAKTIETVEMS